MFAQAISRSSVTAPISTSSGVRFEPAMYFSSGVATNLEYVLLSGYSAASALPIEARSAVACAVETPGFRRAMPKLE